MHGAADGHRFSLPSNINGVDKTETFNPKFFLIAVEVNAQLIPNFFIFLGPRGHSSKEGSRTCSAPLFSVYGSYYDYH